MAGGRSLHSSEGVFLWSAQSVYDTPVTPASTIGICDFNVTDDGDFRQFYSVGKANLHKNKAGNAKVDWQVSIPGFGHKTWLTKAVRSSGALPWLTLGFGSDPYDASPEAWQVANCKIGAFDMSLDGGGILSANFQGIGGAKTTITSLTASAAGADTNDPFMAYEAVLTVNGSGFEVKSMRINVNHNLTPEYVIHGSAPSSAKLRLWDYLTEGNEEITGSFTVSRKEAKDFQAICPAVDGDIVLLLTEACDNTNTIQITLGAAEFLSQARNMPNQGYGDFELPWNAKSIAIA